MIGKILALLSAMLVVGAALAQSGPQCAATPSGAVLRGLGLEAEADSAAGYRVRDVVFDATTHRTYVRVEICGHVERPLLFLPFAEGGSLPSEPGAPTKQNEKPVRANAATLVQPGTLVEVAMLDPRVSLTVHGRLLQSASIGSDVDVQLLSPTGSSESSEQPRHIRGRLTTATRVEVRP